ncbi:MAG TPA: hypothetical protein PLS67_13090 [Accumulibacter sp.]|nr:hypothetical protein [Accumulibacter sp.]HQC81429.1 hypothetical protein [Accumulibacter sp.]
MNSGLANGFDWSALALIALIAAAFIWGLIFFLKQNRKDLESLRKELKSDEDDETNQP